MSNKKSFFSGLEEILGRIISILITMLFFSIYMIARSEPLEVNWVKMLQILGIFVFVYELIGLILFEMFKFFASRIPEEALPWNSNNDQNTVTDPKIEESPQSDSEINNSTEDIKTQEVE